MIKNLSQIAWQRFSVIFRIAAFLLVPVPHRYLRNEIVTEDIPCRFFLFNFHLFLLDLKEKCKKFNNNMKKISTKVKKLDLQFTVFFPFFPPLRSSRKSDLFIDFRAFSRFLSKGPAFLNLSWIVFCWTWTELNNCTTPLKTKNW